MRRWQPCAPGERCGHAGPLPTAQLLPCRILPGRLSLAACWRLPSSAARALLCCPRLFRAACCPLRPALQRLASGPVVVPAAERTPCDLLAWGSAQRAPPVAPSLRSVLGVSDECWQRRSLPGLAPAGQQLDAYRAAVGRKHAAVVTATGAVYAWGEGRGGKLGLGHDQDQPLPQRVRHGLEGRVVTAVACGDDCTAALTEGGELFMWGRLHADSPPQLVPLHVRGGLRGRKVTQVRGAAGRGSVMPARAVRSAGRLGTCSRARAAHAAAVPAACRRHGRVCRVAAAWNRVCGDACPPATPPQVSCGPFHCAAVTADGALFTWGEGFGGKLGHGDQASRSQPTQVRR